MIHDIIRLVGSTTIDLAVGASAAPSDRYILTTGTLLGPPRVGVSVGTTQDIGGVYQGRRPENREITLKIRLNPLYSSGETASDLREGLYSMLSTPDDSIKVQLVRGGQVITENKAYLDAVEPSIFEPDSVVDLTLMFTTPFWEGATTVDAVTSGQAVWNASTRTLTVPNKGSAPVGIQLVMTLTAGPSFLWLDVNGTGQFRVEYQFATNDVVTIDSRPFSKDVRVTRQGVTTRLIHAMTNSSKWPVLRGGNNPIVISTAFVTFNNLNYKPLYWGV